MTGAVPRRQLAENIPAEGQHPRRISGPELTQRQDDTRVVKGGRAKERCSFPETKPAAPKLACSPQWSSLLTRSTKNRVKSERPAKADQPGYAGEGGEEGVFGGRFESTTTGGSGRILKTLGQACEMNEESTGAAAGRGPVTRLKAVVPVSDENQEEATKDKIRAAI